MKSGVSRNIIFVGLLLIISTPASDATGCPYCESKIGDQVKVGIFNEDFGLNTALVLSPILVLLGIVAAVHNAPVQFTKNRWNVR